MSEPVPKWLQLRYSKLFNQFKNNEFSFKSARNVLKKDQDKIISITLSKLRIAGWLTITKLNPNDSRKRYYKLKSPEEIFKDLK